MQQLRRKIVLELYKLADLMIMVCVLAFCMLYFSDLPKEQIQSLVAFFSVKIKLVNVILLGMIIAVWRRIFITFGLYRSRFAFKVGDEFSNIWKAVGIGTMLIATLSFFFDRQNITISILKTRAAGLGPVNCPGVENVDVTELAHGHLGYQSGLGAILEWVGVDGRG